MTQPRKVLFVVAEAFPLVKTGGLGDVAGSLPPALRRLGVDARILLPAYSAVLRELSGITTGANLGAVVPGHAARLLHAQLPGSDVPLLLLDCPELFAREGTPYQRTDGSDWPDNHVRFAALSRAAALLGIAGNLAGWQPDILHANDWHAGLVPFFVRSWRGQRATTVMTIHNLSYQGLFPAPVLPALGIEAVDFQTMSAIEFWGRVSFMKAALALADCVTTVSPTYAREVLTPDAGCGLDTVLAARADRVVGIANGIDEEAWNPATDRHIAQRYAADHLDGKRVNTRALRRDFGLPEEADRPLAGVVSRLVEQKGIDVLVSALPGLLRAGIDLVVLGTGDRPLERTLTAIAGEHPDRIGVRIGYDETLSHRIIAGSDLVLVPSRFEPCGLTQLYGQRYGSLPVVHRVGGLADTVRDYGDGFSFDDLSPHSLTVAIERAVRVFHDPMAWRHLQIQAMTKDLGWGLCARQYDDLYQELTGPPSDG